MQRRLEDKVIVVTGAARGLGKATATLAAEEGAKVAICDVNDKEGKNSADEIVNLVQKSIEGEKKEGSSIPASVEYYHMDVTKEQEVDYVFSKISKELGPIYGLVNNAGVFGTPKPLHELTEEEWDSVFNVTVKGVFFCTKHAVKQMMNQRSGSIVNMSSIYGLVGSSWEISPESYHASRAAVRLMTKVEAVTYGKYNIRVNSIHPGFSDTRPFRQVIEHVIQNQPMQRRGTPEEVAKCIVFLLSTDSSFMTGSELIADGGYTAI